MENKNLENVKNQIVNWLKYYADKANVKGFVIGISGGVDSALTSTLCALTGLNVKCVMMPIHQNPEHSQRAYEHLGFLKNIVADRNSINSCTNDLTETFEQFKKTVVEEQELIQIFTQDQIDFHLANTRARLRMTNLYLHAGLSGYIVAGTGNKVEDYGIGFFTKYGDGGVDISPIGDLLKSEVYQLAAYLNIPQSILNAEPTDGLFGDTRTDEDQIGATYDELEKAMSIYNNLESHYKMSDREKVVYDIFYKRHILNSHKMIMPPICKISYENDNQ